jgi:POT family proton-dependent oligopeptide transporter
MIMPPVLIWGYFRLTKYGPQGSVVIEAFRATKMCLANGGWLRALKGGDGFWDAAKPSVIESQGGASQISKVRITWDDRFVDEVKMAISACKIFLFIPIFAVADGRFGSVQTSQAASMLANGVPNDLISNFNPLTIITVAPILNYGIYPLLRKWNMVPSAMARMSFGFMLAALAMAIGAILQWYAVYHPIKLYFDFK